MSVLDTAEYRRLALIAAGVDPSQIPCILDTATWRRLMLAALYDLSQGGGGSPGYINGSVQFYADLPITVGTPAVNTAYLVRENSGVWFINRRPAGIYVRLFNNGTLDDWDYAGAFPEVNDAQYFRIYDSADPTREVAFNVSGVAAATTRTLTVPNASGTIALNETFAAPPAIGNTTPNSGAFTTLSAAPTFNLTSAGSTAAETPLTITHGRAALGDSLRLLFRPRGAANPNASAEIIARDPNVGGSPFCEMLIRVQNGERVRFPLTTPNQTSAGTIFAENIAFASGGSMTSPDVLLFRDGGANILGLRNAANAQTFRLYNTFTDASNYERGFMRWSSGVFQIGTEKLGTGTRRTLEFVTDGTARWRVGDGSVTAAPSMLALGNSAIFGTNEAYNVIIATGAQGTVNAGVFSPNASNTGYLAIGESLHLGLLNNGSSGDVRLVRDAANVLALRNAASAQTFRLYNTFTSTTNFERLNLIAQTGGSFIIGTEKGSAGGTARNLEFQTDGVTRLIIGTDGSASFTGNMTANNVIGQSGAVFLWSTRTRMYSDADGRIRITNNAQTDFDRLQFGGTTSSFPALKRSSTTLQVRLADDSAFAPFACAGLTLNGDLTASTRNIVTDTTTGTKIGTATTQKIGFFDKTPVVQPTAVADATDAATVITQLNALLLRMRDLGLIAT